MVLKGGKNSTLRVRILRCPSKTLALWSDTIMTAVSYDASVVSWVYPLDSTGKPQISTKFQKTTKCEASSGIWTETWDSSDSRGFLPWKHWFIFIPLIQLRMCPVRRLFWNAGKTDWDITGYYCAKRERALRYLSHRCRNCLFSETRYSIVSSALLFWRCMSSSSDFNFFSISDILEFSCTVQTNAFYENHRILWKLS